MSHSDSKPLLFIIFGISGDLAHRKLLPALYQLYRRGDLPDNFQVVGITRKHYTTTDLFQDFAKYLPEEHPLTATAEALKDHITIVENSLESDADYKDLRNLLEAASESLGEGSNRIYYLSIPAQAFQTVVTHLGETGHNQTFTSESVQPRLLVEKPFGYDTASAQALIDAANTYFDESQLYRIDHYLAKETAQNILTFRFQNPLFRSIWSSQHIDSIRITAHEAIGIEGRAHFYEQTGALRDFLQSHLLQVLALVTMEQPGELTSESIHRSKLRLLQSITPLQEHDLPAKAKRGQYDSYRKEVGSETTNTETFARLYLSIDNEQWRGTEIQLETGKALSHRDSQVTIHFRADNPSLGSNTLIFRLQPHEGITLNLQAKTPGLGNETETVDMEFNYAGSFGENSAEAYERVIIDAVRGDQSLFASGQEVMTSWNIVEEVLKYWQTTGDDLVIYPSGSAPQDL